MSEEALVVRLSAIGVLLFWTSRGKVVNRALVIAGVMRAPSVEDLSIAG